MAFLNVLGLFRKLFKFDRPVGPMKVPDKYLGDPAAMQAASWYHAQLQYITNRRQAYREYEEMENYGLIHSALNMFAEEATQPDFTSKKIIWIENCKNQKVIEIANELFDRLDIQNKSFTIIRSIAKYGDTFMQLLYDMNDGIINWKYVSPELFTRVEDSVGRLLGFAPGIIDAPIDVNKLPENMAKPWDVIHFRNQSIKPDNVHGDSLLFGVRATWRQLKILEDFMIYYRILRSPDRWVYYIETGEQTPAQAWQSVETLRKAVRYREFRSSPELGQYRTESIPLSIVDDFFWNMRNGQPQVKVEKFEGKPYVMNDISDIEFFRNKFFSELRIPKGAMGFEGDINARATLLQQDVRFARTIKTLRQIYVTGIAQLLQLQLSFKGIDPLDPDNHFTVAMAPVSYLDEVQKSELYNIKATIAQTFLLIGKEMELNKKQWFSFVLEFILNLTPKEIENLLPKEFAPAVEPELPIPPVGISGGPTGVPPKAPSEAPPEKPPGESFQGIKQLTSSEKALLEKIVNSNSKINSSVKNFYNGLKAQISSKEIKFPVTAKLSELVKNNSFLFTEEHFIEVYSRLEEVAKQYKKEEIDRKQVDKKLAEEGEV